MRNQLLAAPLLFACLLAPLAFAAGPGSKAILWSVEWSPDGRSFAVGGEWSRVFDAETGSPLPSPTFGDSYSISHVRWHPEGRLLAVSGGTEEATAIHDIATGQKISLPTRPPVFSKPGARGVAWDATGTRLATASSDGSLAIWSATGDLLHRSKAENAKSLTGVAWHPREDKIITVGGFIGLHDETGKLLRKIAHRPQQNGLLLLLCVAWHPSGDFFAVGDYGNNDTGAAPAIQLWSASGTLLKTIEIPGGAAVRNLRWSPEGNLLATASDALRIWSKDGELLHTGASPDRLWDVSWHNDGIHLLTSSEEGRITLWDSRAVALRRIVEPAP